MDIGVNARFQELIEQGEMFKQNNAYWIPDSITADGMTWITSAANLINKVSQNNSVISSTLEKILNHTDYITGSSLPVHTLQKLKGLLESTYNEYQTGMLKDYQYIIFAEAFDDFLDQAIKFHKGGKKIESAILASVVFEDTIKKIWGCTS